MLNFFSNIFGSKNDRILKRMMSLVNTANNMEQELSEKPDSYFLELKDQLKPLCKNFVDFGNYFSENIDLD